MGVLNQRSKNEPDMRARLGLRMRITVALAVTAAATALFAVLWAMWIIAGIVDRADQRELRSHYDALLSRIAEESHRAAAMSAVVAAMPATQDAMARQDRDALVGLFGPVFAATKSEYGVDGRGRGAVVVDEISAAIAAAVSQQGTTTQEIAQNVQQAAARTGEVSQNIAGVTDGIAATGTAAEEVLGSAVELSKQSQRLRDEVDRFLAHIRAA